MCEPRPTAGVERIAGDGLMHCVVTLAHALARLPGVEMHVLSRSRRITGTRTVARDHASSAPGLRTKMWHELPSA